MEAIATTSNGGLTTSNKKLITVAINKLNDPWSRLASLKHSATSLASDLNDLELATNSDGPPRPSASAAKRIHSRSATKTQNMIESTQSNIA